MRIVMIDSQRRVICRVGTIKVMACTLLAVGVLASEGSNAVEPIADTQKTLLAIDDHSIPWKNNLKLTLVKPAKHPSNPVVPRGGKGMPDEWAVQFYGSVLHHDGKYKAWYIAADDESLELVKKGKGFSGLRPAYAESADGIHWKKPKLGLVEHNGSKQNNLVAMDPPETAGIHVIVIHEENEPDPACRFKMVLTAAAWLGESKGSTTITLFSADGLSWHSPTKLRFDQGFLLGEDLILPPINFEQGGLFKMNGMYYLPGQQFSPSVWQPDGTSVGRVMVTLRSRDLIHWEECSALGFIRGTAIGKVGKVSEDEEAHLASSIWNRGNVQIGIYGLWHGAANWQERGLDLGLMVSNDGLHFREPIRDYVLIPAGNIGEWDEGGLLQGQGFFNIGDKTRIYYGSWDLTKPDYPPRGGIGLVTLRRDGFGYLSQKYKGRPARLETLPILPNDGSTQLSVNIENISKHAPLMIELLDSQSRPVSGYSGEQAATVSSDGVQQTVVWPASKSSNIDLREPFSVRVMLPVNGDARVYALYVGGQRS